MPHLMEIVHTHGDKNLAQVYAAKFRNDEKFLAEFVSVKDRNRPLTEKWVIIISTQFGCPVNCPICDAGSVYNGNLTADEMISQVDYIIDQSPIPPQKCKKFKIQFARMGEPAFNNAVLDVLKILPNRYRAENLIPCISTIAPKNSSNWFEELLEIKKKSYNEFQLQFSVHSTSETERDCLMPAPKWSLQEISEYGNRFINSDKRRASLNFALTNCSEFKTEKIAKYFSPEKFCIKITPVNPTDSSVENGVKSEILDKASEKIKSILSELKDHGFDTILSIGDLHENEIGSNCGMVVKKFYTRPAPFRACEG